MLVLCCYTWALSSCGEQGLFFICGARSSHCSGFSYCGARAPYLHHAGLVALEHVELPGPGIEPVSPAVAGRDPPTVPPGKCWELILKQDEMYNAPGSLDLPCYPHPTGSHRNQAREPGYMGYLIKPSSATESPGTWASNNFHGCIKLVQEYLPPSLLQNISHFTSR